MSTYLDRTQHIVDIKDEVYIVGSVINRNLLTQIGKFWVGTAFRDEKYNDFRVLFTATLCFGLLSNAIPDK